MLTIAELAELPLFAGVAAPELERLTRTAADIHLVPGEYAVHEGERGPSSSCSKAGSRSRRSSRGSSATIGVREPGDLFGEVPLILGTPFPASLRASEPARVMRIDAKDFHAVAAVAPEVAPAVGASARDRIDGLQDIAAETPAPK